MANLNPASLLARLLSDYERKVIESAILDIGCEGGIKAVAAHFGVPQDTFSARCSRLGINTRELKNQSIALKREREKAARKEEISAERRERMLAMHAAKKAEKGFDTATDEADAAIEDFEDAAS